jgi:hypothetical protein
MRHAVQTGFTYRPLALLPVWASLFLLAVPQVFGRPIYFARYKAFMWSRQELNTCAICHLNPKGGGPRNEFGQAYGRAGHQFTEALRTQFPDRFQRDRAHLSGGVEVVFGSEPGSILIKDGGNTYKVDLAAKDLVAVAQEPSTGAKTAAAPAPEKPAVQRSPVFDYVLVDLRSGKVADKGEFNFRFSHRFSTPVFNQNNRPYDMFGLDSFAYTGFGVSYGISNRLAVDVYRQALNRKIEFSGDLALLNQEKSKAPLTLLARAAVEGKNDFAGQGHNGHYIPSIQLVASRTFLNRFTVMVDPTFAFNLKRPDNGAVENTLVTIGLGGSIKLRENMAIVGEFIPRVSGNPFPGDFIHAEPTASFGFQFRTERHVFEFVISNSWETTTAGSALGGPDEKHIGFNIFRRIK